jgi:hypothetical protein
MSRVRSAVVRKNADVKLLTVVPVVRELQLGGGWRIVVASVELWAKEITGRPASVTNFRALLAIRSVVAFA